MTFLYSKLQEYSTITFIDYKNHTFEISYTRLVLLSDNKRIQLLFIRVYFNFLWFCLTPCHDPNLSCPSKQDQFSHQRIQMCKHCNLNNRNEMTLPLEKSWCLLFNTCFALAIIQCKTRSSLSM